MLTIYTRELGLVSAAAQGVRLAKSKLRFALIEYSRARIDLVRGRDIWRVTSASPVESFALLRADHASFAVFHNICRLLERLAAGEEPNPLIFDDFLSTLGFLNRAGVTDGEREAAELILVLRILNNLGYVSENEALKRYVADRFDPAAAPADTLPKKTILFEINRALRESHL